MPMLTPPTASTTMVVIFGFNISEILVRRAVTESDYNKFKLMVRRLRLKDSRPFLSSLPLDGRLVPAVV